MPRIPRPSPAMLVAVAVLVAAMGGVGYAQVQERLDGRNLEARSVSTPKLQLGSVRTPQLGTGAVTTTKLRTGAVTARKVAPGAIGTTELADAGVRSTDLAEASVGSPQIADGAVGNPELAVGAVTDVKIAPGTISRARLAADAQVPLTTVRRSAVVGVGTGTIGTATASCLPGERATGGGSAPAAPTSGVLYPVGGYPVPNGDGDVPTAWTGFVVNNSGAPQSMVAFVVCARAG
ncbi:MAG: hypothetical protein AB7V62_06715 [Thermoleophilia bacterium]